ncbi:hypothetical protein BDZ89DRAFT_1062956 [Hymenopellis radicata]|nr:hypothetical protein BDZ89DRAFT_1062956 [Hymenopellis radicata]
MDQHFKIECAKEEILRLNVEITRFVTWIHDEDRYLEDKRLEWEQIDECIAFRIDLYRRSRARFNSHHLQLLAELSLMPGFTGSLAVGKRKERGAGSSDEPPMDLEEPIAPPIAANTAQSNDADDEEDEDNVEQDEDLNEVLAKEIELVARISED